MLAGLRGWIEAKNESSKGRRNAKRVRKGKIDVTYHLQRPHPTNPYLELSLHTLNVLELDSLPPASSCRLPPEQQQLLRHSHCVAAGQV